MLELLPKVGPFLIFFEGILNLFFNVVLVESLDVGQSTEHVEHFVETWIPLKKKAPYNQYSSKLQSLNKTCSPSVQCLETHDTQLQIQPVQTQN